VKESVGPSLGVSPPFLSPPLSLSLSLYLSLYLADLAGGGKKDRKITRARKVGPELEGPRRTGTIDMSDLTILDKDERKSAVGFRGICVPEVVNVREIGPNDH
jgi:hypothetical protein